MIGFSVLLCKARFVISELRKINTERHVLPRSLIISCSLYTVLLFVFFVNNIFQVIGHVTVYRIIRSFIFFFILCSMLQFLFDFRKDRMREQCRCILFSAFVPIVWIIIYTYIYLLFPEEALSDIGSLLW